MSDESSVDRLVLRGLALCLLASLLSGCMAGAAATVLSQTARTTAKAAGPPARLTLDGARVTSRAVTRPFRGGEDEEIPSEY